MRRRTTKRCVLAWRGRSCKRRSPTRLPSPPVSAEPSGSLGAEEIEEVERSLAGVETAATLDSLRGFEGIAAAHYFRCLSALVPPDFAFQGRSRRPPRDPVNALLSFGYVLVGNEIQSLLDAMGFDPYLSFYHSLDYGRPSLTLDLLEELRAALVDRWTVSLLNLGVMSKADFTTTAEGGVLLGRDGMRRYFPAYEKQMATPFAADGEELTFRQCARNVDGRGQSSAGGEDHPGHGACGHVLRGGGAVRVILGFAAGSATVNVQAACSRRYSMLPGRSRMSRSSMSIAPVWTFRPDSQREMVFAPRCSRRARSACVSP